MRHLILMPLLALVIALGCEADPVGTLEYYEGSKYPGATLRENVERYIVTTESAKPGELARRDVKFWPRAGVDLIPVDKRMPLRTWTFRAEAATPWGRKYNPVEAGEDPRYREEYWDCLASFDYNVRAGLLLAFVKGYIIPPKTGKYTFYYSADDRGAFYLSSDANPANTEPLAYNRDYSRKGNYFFRGPEQQSRIVTLEAGKKYYFEAAYEDVGGGNWMSVAWTYQGRTFPEIIDGRYLESLDGKKGYARAEYYRPGGATAWNQYTENKTLKAHLIGFRGVGNASIASPKGKTEGRMLPHAVLRLPDGRKRAFPGLSFSEADQDFLEQEFIKARKQVYDASPKIPYQARPELTNAESQRPEKPGQPGMWCEETDHMSFFAGSQSQDQKKICPWINEPDLEAGRIYRERAKAWSENMWLLYDYSGHIPTGLDYYDGVTPPTKYQLTVAGTLKNGYDPINGFAGGGYGGCVGRNAALGILAHEYGHGPRMTFGGEAGSDSCATFCFPGPKGNPHVKRGTHRNFYGGGVSIYGLTTFTTTIGDDPNWGYVFHIAMPKSAPEYSIAQTMSRVIEQRGLAKNGIKGFGDLLGEYGARIATFDYELEAEFQQAIYTPTLSLMERIDADKPIYRVHSDYEPEAYGINIVRLDTTPGAKKITVDFQGMIDPANHSDWRACIVAVDKNGLRRYSDLWNTGRQSLDVRPDDAAHFLTVAATPSAISLQKKVPVTGKYAPTYPWEAEIAGATPGTNARRLGDLGTVVTKYAGALLPPRRTATTQIQQVKDQYASLKKIVDSKPKTEAEAQERFRTMLRLLPYKRAMDMLGPGKPHANGGGWVADTATVDETAYVGPTAMVLGVSEVRDNAIIEDGAIVTGRSVISDHAKIAAGTKVADTVIGGYTRVWDTIQTDKNNQVRPLPLRNHETAMLPSGLWAHYAMEGDGGLRLDDYYRMNPEGKQGHTAPLGISMHGFVYGQPEYVKQDGKWGMKISKPSQYAMLNPRAVDLSEITLAMTLRREKAVRATVLDLGSNKDNCMVLKLNKKGVARFVATQGGKPVVKLVAKTALPLNQWSKLRVEIDGKTASLIVNGKQEVSVKTSFRPCDVALAGAPQQNFLGNSRQKNRPLMGTLDELVIYSQVNDDFASLPRPILDAPIRPSQGVVEAVADYEKYVTETNAKLKKATPKAKPEDDKSAGRYARLHAGSKYAKQFAYYDRMKQRIADRTKELDARDDRMSKAQANLAAKEAEKKKAKGELMKKAALLPEVAEAKAKVDQLNKQCRPLGQAFHKAKQAFLNADPKLAAMRKKMNELRKTDRRGQKKETRELRHKMHMYERTLRDQIEALPEAAAYRPLEKKRNQAQHQVRRLQGTYVTRNLGKIDKEIGTLKNAVNEARTKAQAPYLQEYRALGTAYGAGFAGHYNFPLIRFMAGDAETAATGQLQPRGNASEVQDRLENWNEPNAWRTEIDWDWRYGPEAQGNDLENLPMMKRWIERVRGPVVTKRPVGTNPKQ